MELNTITRGLRKILKNRFFRNDNIITYMEAKELLRNTSNGILLDVRSFGEYNEYHLNGAICIPHYELENRISKIIENKEQLIVVYCQSGGRSKKAVNILKRMGYANIYQLDGGIDNI